MSMKYALLNPDGSIAQACNDDTVTELPAGAIELTDEQFAGWPNYRAVDGELVLSTTSGPVFSNQKSAFIKGFVSDRDRMINRLSYLAGRAHRAGDLPKAAVCDALSETLIALTSHATVDAARDIDSLKAAMKTLYDAAVYAATTHPNAPTLLDDFKRMNK